MTILFGSDTHDDRDHASRTFSACDITGQYKDQNRNRDSGDCQGEFDIFLCDDNDDKLNSEAEKEEEIEFEECNVNLIRKNIVSHHERISGPRQPLPDKSDTVFSFLDLH